MKKFVANAFNRHCFECHNADFEVCHHWRCQLARWLELTFDLWGWNEA